MDETPNSQSGKKDVGMEEKETKGKNSRFSSLKSNFWILSLSSILVKIQKDEDIT